MCGCSPRQEFFETRLGIDLGFDPIETLTTTFAWAGVGGVLITFIASLILLRGPRQWLAAVILVLLVMALAMVTETIRLNHRIELSVAALVMGAAVFLAMLSVIRWPTSRRWINLPALIGAGLGLIAAPLMLVIGDLIDAAMRS